MCLCGEISARYWASVFLVWGCPRRGKYKNIKMVSLTYKMRSKCRGHDISIGHFSSISQHRIKMFSVLRLAPSWHLRQVRRKLTLTLKFGKMREKNINGHISVNFQDSKMRFE